MSFPESVSSAEMRELDRRATEEFGIPALLLMENAGRGVAELIFAEMKTGPVTVFAGKGNNGGDGFVAARHLYNHGFSVTVFLLADPGDLRGEAALHFQIALKLGIPVHSSGNSGSGISGEFMLEQARNSGWLIDAIFGTGLKKPLEGIYSAAVQSMNESGVKVLSVDIPSGLDSDTGEVRGTAVKADLTAALGAVKHGLLRGAGPAHAGKISVVDIGLPFIKL